jgi:hypothetical protein
MKSPVNPPLTEHAVVGVFEDGEAARRALDALRDARIPPTVVSLLCRDGREVRQAMGLPWSEDPTPVVDEVAEGAAEGALVGAAVGGVLGLLAGAVAFAIPGIGPVVGTGIWAAVTAGLAGGATLGLMVGGMRKVWETTYRDAVAEGRVLVSVHSEDPDIVEQAEKVLRQMGPLRLDHFDEGGELLHEHVELPRDGKGAE